MEKKVQDHLRLKEFIEENIPVDELLKVGFFGKGKNKVKKTDYVSIADRVCKFFGYRSIYQYSRNIYDDRQFSNSLLNNNRIKGNKKWETLKISETDIKTKEEYLN